MISAGKSLAQTTKGKRIHFGDLGRNKGQKLNAGVAWRPSKKSKASKSKAKQPSDAPPTTVEEKEWKMISARKVKDVIADLSKSVAEDAAYGDEVVAIDMWDRVHFSEFVEHEFTPEAWLDFVDFCSNESVDWGDWFEVWRLQWDAKH